MSDSTMTHSNDNAKNSPTISNHSGRSIKKLYSRSVRALRTSKHADALLITQEIIDRQPDHAGAHAVQFSSLFKSKKFELARLIGNQAARLNPKSVFILNNQACLELEKNNPTPAAHLLSSLIDQYGERAQWLYNLALAYELTGRFEKAISIFRRTLDQNPSHDKAARQLAETLEKVGHYEEACQAYDYWRILSNKNATSHGQYIHCAVNSNNISVNSLRQELGLWGDKFIPKDSAYEIALIDSTRALNIGFITSASVQQNHLNETVIPVIDSLTNNGDTLFVYSHKQNLTLNENVNNVNITDLSDANFARRVRADNIDILIDLCGMRQGNRQRALGLQLASKQFSWLGHEGLFATPRISSLEEKLQARQKVYFCKQHKTSQKDDHRPWPDKTFAGICAQKGLSYSVIKTWANVLLQCPDWVIEIQTGNNPQLEKLLAQRFSAAGINKERVLFSHNTHYSDQTIVLDNFIQNDPVQLSSAIFDGATVVTIKGKLFPAQHSHGVMQQLGFESDVSTTEYAFMQRAVALANGEQSLSPLDNRSEKQKEWSDVSSFTKHFRTALLS